METYVVLCVQNSDVCQGNLYTSDQNDLRARCFVSTNFLQPAGLKRERERELIYNTALRYLRAAISTLITMKEKKKENGDFQWYVSIIRWKSLFATQESCLYTRSIISSSPVYLYTRWSVRWRLVRLGIRVVSTLYRQRKFYLNVCANERVSLWA